MPPSEPLKVLLLAFSQMLGRDPSIASNNKKQKPLFIWLVYLGGILGAFAFINVTEGIWNACFS